MGLFAAPCFADFDVKVTVKESKVTLFEHEPVLVYYNGNTPQYAPGKFTAHVVLTNKSGKDVTIKMGSCNRIDWATSDSSLRLNYAGCEDYSTVGPRVLKSGEKIETEAPLSLDDGTKPGEFKFKLGYRVGYAPGSYTEDRVWSNEVSIQVVDGTNEQKAEWKKKTGA